MRSPSGKWTIRSLMIAVLAIATAGAGWVYLGRSRAFGSLAEQHRVEEEALTSVRRQMAHVADIFEGKAPYDQTVIGMMPVQDTRQIRASEAEYARRADYHAALTEKYRRAAGRPWISVKPDPPSP